MNVFFRAVVMLATLVGLPAAWVYYGPLPQNAQRIVDRFVQVARDALGGESPLPTNFADQRAMKTAPRYGEPTPTGHQLTQPQTDFRASPVQLVSAESMVPLPSVEPTPAIDDEMQTHLSVLKSLGVAQYALERWGQGYRFKCEIPLGGNVDFTQHFEAVDADALATVRQVVGEVTSWQNARHDPSGTIWR